MSRRRILVIATAALAVLVAGAVLAWPEIVRRVAARQLAAVTGRAVALGAADLDLLRGRLALWDLRVMDRDRGPLMAIGRLEVRFRPRDLLRGHVRITRAVLDSPAVRIVRTGPREFNIADLLVREPAGGPALPLTLERFEVHSGAVAIEDRTLAPPRAWQVESLTLEAEHLSTVPGAPPGVVRLSAVAAGSPIALWVGGVRLAPLQFQATAIARGIDASLAALYLPPGSPLSPVRGTLDVSATIAQEAGAGHRLSLDAVFGGVELRPPGRDGTALSLPAVRVTVEDLRLREGTIELGRLAVDGGTAVLEDQRLAPVRRWQAEDIAVEARSLSSARDAPAGVGTARARVAGSPVSIWAGALRLAPLALHATVIVRDVDFALFRLYVPPGLPVQPERGTVNASVRIDHDERGTRLALDAGLGNVEVRRQGHLVTAPALQVRAEDIAFAAGAVTVGRATLAGDRLTLEDRTLTPPRRWDVRGLAVEATRLSSRRADLQGVATARATVAGASVSIWITQARIDPLELRATAILRDFDVALAQLYLPPTAPVQLARGAVDASVQLDHDLAGGTRLTGDVTIAGLQARGRGPGAGVAASATSLRVALADARRHEQTLHVGRLELTASDARVDPGPAARADLDRLRLAGEGLTWPVRGPAQVELSARLRDGGEVEARGSALLTAPPPMVAWTADLAVKLRAVDLAPVTAHLPVAGRLRGTASATAAVNMAYGASLTARVQGDAGLTRLALAGDGARPVAVRQIDVTGLDLLWPERIAAGRVRVERPRLLIERDRHGGFPLLARLAPAGPAPPGPAEAAGPARPASWPVPAVALDEVVIERGALTYADARAGAPVRLEVPRVDLTVREARWPATAPARVRLEAALPEGGSLTAEGLVDAAARSVDLKVALADAGLAVLQPYLPFTAGLAGRADVNVVVAGPLAPAPRLTARGEATLRALALSDGPRPVLTVERLGVTGMEVAWPERASVDRLTIRRSWALIERDREGRFLLRTLLGRPPGAAGPAPAASGPPATPPFEFRLGEGVFEDQGATIVDGVTSPPARFEVAGARLAVRDLTWPARGPVKLEVTSPTPGGGRLDVDATLDLAPGRLAARARLDAVELAPAQPYLPIEARVAGRVSGDVSVGMTLEPLSVQVEGQARLQRFRLSDGDRPFVTAGRLEATGIEVDWPRRIAVQRVLLRRPSVLIERDAQGAVAFLRLVRPRWPAKTEGASPAPEGARAAPGPARPAIEIATLDLERASGRFIDLTTTPPFAEELSGVDLTVTGLTTTPGRRAQFTGGGGLGGGARFRLRGEVATGEVPGVELKVDLMDYPVARASPYLARFTAWTASRGTLSAAARYAVAGTRLDAEHDVTVRGLQVQQSGDRDQVAQRLGLPLSFLVAVLEDARGELRLTVPVAGDLGTRQFDFQEAVWGAVRALAIRLLALPFSRIGSLFFTEDSRVESVAVAPTVFGAGTAHLGPAMAEHLDRVADFLRGAAALNVRLAPILTQADLDALKRDRVRARLGGGDAMAAARGEFRARWPDRPVPETLEAIVAGLADAEPAPDEAVRGLAARRVETVRRELVARGVDAGRFEGGARRVPLVEAAGTPRVELDLRE